MPIHTLNTIKSWFKTTLKPTQDQFWDTWDSFRHKFEKVPLKDVEDLEVTLNKKAEKSQLDAHQTNLNAHSDLFAKKEDNANKGVANGYVPLDDVAKIASQYLDIINDLNSGGSNSLLSAEQGVVLQNQINQITNLLASDNSDLNTIQKIVDAIEEVQMSLSTILVNDLTTGGTTKALTAEMGKKLDEIKANLESPAFTGVPTAPTAVLGTNTTQIATTEFVKTALNNVPSNGVLSVAGTGINNSDPKNPIIEAASSTRGGVIDTTSLQNLGGVDKIINDVRIGKGEGTGVNNTVVGVETLSFNTSGDNNTSVGSLSLNKNTVGNNNTAVGFKALNNNSSGNNNTSVGYFTQGNITTGSNNTSIGHTSLSKSTTGSGNTSAGYATLTNNTTGANNTAVGFKALAVNTTGFENTSIGLNSGSRVTTGRDNTSIGTDSLGNRSNTATAITGNYNIAVGSFAGSDITSGSNNILIENGNTSGSGAITTGSNNIIVNGKNATGITTGSNNTVIGGYNGGFNPTDTNLVVLGSGSGVTAIRKEADNRLLAPTLTNALIDSGGNKSLITKEYLDTHSGGGGSQNLQSVTENANETNQGIGIKEGTNPPISPLSLYVNGLTSYIIARGKDMFIRADNNLRLNAGAPIKIEAHGLRVYANGNYGEYSAFLGSDDSKFSRVKGADGTEPDDFVTKRQLNEKVNSISPSFTGVPTAPTAVTGTNSTQIATTEFVKTAVEASGGGGSQDLQSVAKTIVSQETANWELADYGEETLIYDYMVGSEDENLMIMFQCYWSNATPAMTPLIMRYTISFGEHYAYEKEKQYDGNMGSIYADDHICGRFRKNTHIKFVTPRYYTYSRPYFSVQIIKFPNI